MKAKIFDDMCDRINEQRNKLMRSKRHDYAGEIDVLSNFKRIPELLRMLGIEPERSAFDYAMFMVVMKVDRMMNLTNKGESPQAESIIDTVCDAHNYLALAYGCYEESPPRERVIAFPQGTLSPENKKCWDCVKYVGADGIAWVHYGEIKLPYRYGCEKSHDVDAEGEALDIDKLGCPFYEQRGSL